MTDPSKPPRFPSWLAPAVVVLLGMQLLLGWVQGSLLHREHEDLLALREDVQSLTDSVEQGFAQDSGAVEGLDPVNHRKGTGRHFQRVILVQAQPTDEDPARKELEDANASAKNAVNQARTVQSQLSIEENVRKADEKAKLEAAENHWQKWLFGALGLGLVALAVRAWMNRRG